MAHSPDRPIRRSMFGAIEANWLIRLKRDRETISVLETEGFVDHQESEQCTSRWWWVETVEKSPTRLKASKLRTRVGNARHWTYNVAEASGTLVGSIYELTWTSDYFVLFFDAQSITQPISSSCSKDHSRSRACVAPPPLLILITRREGKRALQPTFCAAMVEESLAIKIRLEWPMVAETCAHIPEQKWDSGKPLTEPTAKYSKLN